MVTTYRVTEHHTAGGMSRTVPVLAELQPELFCEVSPELAELRGLEHGGWATIVTTRTAIEARVLVTRRMAPLQVSGQRLHQVGLPYHWGYHGPVSGDVVNDLFPVVPIRTSASRRARRRPATSCPAGGRGAPRCAASCRSTSRPRSRRSREQRPASPVVARLLRRRAQPRMGFFTDTTLCIGCKACEVACKEWNVLPTDALGLTGMSYDNTGELGASTWRHVAFVEQAPPAGRDGGRRPALADVLRRVQALHPRGLPRGLPDGRPVPHRARHRGGAGRRVQRLRLLHPRLPVRRDRQARGDGRAFKCTLCYDRTRGGLTPACAQACPTESIQYGPLDDLRERARARLSDVVADGHEDARLYLDTPDDGIGGAGAFFLLLDEPEVYGLPPDPVAPTLDQRGAWLAAGAAAATLVAGIAAAFGGRRR